MGFNPVQKLNITRTLSTGAQITLGTLAQNRQGVFFQYDAGYIKKYGNASPFQLDATLELQLGPKNPHGGLHGVFADSLPDGWGLLLQDRVFRQQGILPSQLTLMDRLAFVGHSALGALSFDPVYPIPIVHEEVDLATLGLQAQALFDGQTDQVLTALVTAGSSGGARPKAQIYFSPNHPEHCRTIAQANDDAWLIKFTSAHLPLGHEEGLCEAAYLTLAAKAQLQPVEWQLLDAPSQSGVRRWLAVKRFDWVNLASRINHNAHIHHHAGRYHVLSACGLLDADFRSPSLDYAELIKASRMLCQSPVVGQLQFRRAMFNLFACNQDDHSKNWAFLQDDKGAWQPTPCYDVTFSLHPFGEHATAFAGFGKQPSLKAVQQLANHAGFKNWQQAQQVIKDVVEAIASFKDVAKSLGISSQTTQLIGKQLDMVWQQNKQLIV